MLILTRRIGETIVIDQNIKVTVLDIKGCQVRIGVEAPRGVAVDRLEIAVRKAQGPQQRIETETAQEAAEKVQLFANRTVDEWREILANEASTPPLIGSRHD